MIRNSIKYESEINLKKIAELIYQVFTYSNPELFLPENYQMHIDFIVDNYHLENHNLSYQNFIVFEKDYKIIALIQVIADDESELLDANSNKLFKEKFGIKKELFKKQSKIGELYLSLLSVNKKYQGQGIGTKLINYVYKNSNITKYKSLSLNVKIDNLNAKKLYERLGFISQEIMVILGNKHYHMIKPFKIKN